MRIPRHIGIIPDGNRRWANGEGMGKEKGYEHGLDPGLKVLKMAQKYGVEEITYYGFTVDNCKRPYAQIEAFSKACVAAVELIGNENVDLLVVGNTKSKFFPEQLKLYADKRVCSNKSGFDAQKRYNNQGADTDKASNRSIKVNFLVNYGWKWDLENAFASKEISRIDMIIRWGGMRRLSGFLPIQSVYADFFVVDKLWPDYENKDFEAAIEWYQKQDITLGG